MGLFIERGSSVIELSEGEFREQVDLARSITHGVYVLSAPLLTLGYNGAQIRALNAIYSAVEEGDATDARWNLNYPFYRHHARFENELGSLAYEFSGNGDFQVLGRVAEVIERRNQFPIGTHPHLFLLKKQGTQDIEIRDIAQRIFRGQFAGETDILKRTLSRIGVMKAIPQVRNSYQSQWLDEDTKMDAVFYFPAQDKYEVFRKVKTNGGYEVWGRRRNINSQQIKQALSEKNQGKVFTFQLAPQQVKA